jgi:hypothetical protein
MRFEVITVLIPMYQDTWHHITGDFKLQDES